MEYHLFNKDCFEFAKSDEFIKATKGKVVIVVTDPPFNVGYHYDTYKDKVPEDIYYKSLAQLFYDCGSIFVVIHYPESIYKIASATGRVPNRVVSWVYNSNTPRQHRDIAFFGLEPAFSQMTQPYKNPNDKRIAERIAEGHEGSALYDWWYCDQVKNISDEKYEHPCQMPIQIMENIVGIIPNRDEIVVYDPFMGTCTTGLACKRLGIDFIGTEIDEKYFKISQDRMNGILPNGQATLF
jgi:DNA modification methylase